MLAGACILDERRDEEGQRATGTAVKCGLIYNLFKEELPLLRTKFGGTLDALRPWNSWLEYMRITKINIKTRKRLRGATPFKFQNCLHARTRTIQCSIGYFPRCAARTVL